jgi:hypothetical protein
LLRIRTPNISEKMNSELLFNASEKEAAASLGVSDETLPKWRRSGKVPPHTYVKFGYKSVRYCIPLLRDWQLDPSDLNSQIRAIELIQESRPSNTPRKKGRKSAA